MYGWKAITSENRSPVRRAFSGHGEKDRLFEKVHSEFLTKLSVTQRLHYQKPSVKTLRDKLRSMLASRKNQNARNEKASGISEIETEETQLLDDFLHEIEESKLSRKQLNDELNFNENRLVKSGKEIRELALKRQTSNPDLAAPSPKKRKRNEDTEFSDFITTLRDEMVENRSAKRDELTLRQRELDLQEKRFAADEEERAHGRENEKNTLELLKLLAKKLE